MEGLKEKVAEAAHVIHRKASNTVKDIQSGDAKHIIERKARNTVEDIKEFAGGVGEKLAPAAAKVGEVAHDAYEKVKPAAEKAGHAVSDAAHKVTDKVKETVSGK